MVCYHLTIFSLTSSILDLVSCSCFSIHSFSKVTCSVECLISLILFTFTKTCILSDNNIVVYSWLYLTMELIFNNKINIRK